MSMLTFYFANLSAQITIGSSEKTLLRALLQLGNQTELTHGTPNTIKSLGMPRVVLSTIDKLYQMLPNGYSSVEDDIHVGLIVYNTTEGNGFCPGLYVWQGGKWEELSPVSKLDITVTDIDDNKYIARRFSNMPCDPNTNGAYWFRATVE